ncbi:MAG: hypothetical protein ACO3A2_09065 [Bdellovibrionia bacterium]
MQTQPIAPESKEAAEPEISEIRFRAKKVATQASGNVTQAYHEARGWLTQNSGKALSVVGILATLGAIGFYLYKNSFQPEYKGKDVTS